MTWFSEKKSIKFFLFLTGIDNLFILMYSVRYKENIIYFRGEFTRNNCKTAILLYCFHTAGVLHVFTLYNLLGPEISF